MYKRTGKNGRMSCGYVLAAVLFASSLTGCGVYEPINVNAAQETAVTESSGAQEAQETEAAAETTVMAPEETAPETVALEAETTAQETTAQETTAQEADDFTAQSAAIQSFVPRDETVYVQTDNVNVRTSPEVVNGTDAGSGNLAFLARRGDSFHRTAYSDSFSKVERDGKEYYISSQYLSVNAPAEEQAAAQKENGNSASGSDRASAYENGQEIGLNPDWKYADFAEIKSGKAVLYKASSGRKGKIIAVNAGHGTQGGTSVKTWCHPDKTPKVTGGTTGAGATKAVAVSSGMTFNDGTQEKKVTLRMAQILKEKLLAAGYDVLMLRDGEDVQLDNVARTVIANNAADCHIALHWDGDGLSTIKGCFYMSVPDKLKSMEPVASHWQEHERLGDALIAGLKAQGLKIWGSNPLDMDLTQTSYSTVPSVDVELGNQCSKHDDATLSQEADGLVAGVNSFFGL
ncbi:MAG: N-acetylmuramoyl-L-alanine amidase [Eubacteriales bacterium]|nr:N-acetylmuramoyl-L-alanine amidase [Eubacteriales bacterium]